MKELGKHLVSCMNVKPSSSKISIGKKTIDVGEDFKFSAKEYLEQDSKDRGSR